MVKNLQSSTKYFYVVGDQKYGFSKEFSFTTQPSKHKYASDGFSFIFYGDMGIDVCDPSGSDALTSSVFSTDYRSSG